MAGAAVVSDVKLRIVSDGTAPGTRVEDEDGRTLHGVQSVEWKVEVGEGMATATLVVHRVPVDVVGRLEG